MLRTLPRSRFAIALLLLASAVCGSTSALAQDSVNPGSMEPMPAGPDSGAVMGDGYNGYPMMGSPYQDGCGNGNCGGGCNSGCCDSGCYGGGCDSGCCEMRPIRMPAYHQPMTYMYVDWLDLHVAGGDVAHAQQQNGLGGAGTVPFGDIGTLDIDFTSGVRVGGEIACNGCSGVAVDYTYFSSDTTDTIDAPTIPGGGGAVGSLVHHPGAAITASAGPVDATYGVDFQLADVVFRHVWLTGRKYVVNYSLGAEYGHLQQDFSQTGVFGGGQSGTIDTTTAISFDGGGLKAGVDGEQRLCCCFFAYGKASAAALSGRFDSHYELFNSTTETLLARSNWEDNRVIGQFDAELGVGWSRGCWRISAGYMFSEWTNIVDTSSLIDAVQADNYTGVRNSLTFDGLVTRIECCW
jgi:Legionella pneumophila major outer membrane protein precursor